MAKAKLTKQYVEDFHIWRQETNCCLCEGKRTKSAVKVCHECDLFICGKCLVWHAKFPYNKEHYLVPLENKIAFRPKEITEGWNIQGFCQTSDGLFLLFDTSGTNLMRFDSNFLNGTSLYLGRTLFDYISLCVMDNGQAAVGGQALNYVWVRREIKIIKIRPHMEVVRSFQIDLIPKDIAYSQNKLYICGSTIQGLIKKAFGFSQGYIAVYSVGGIKLQTIPNSPDTGFFDAKLFSLPVAIECFNKSIYVIDQDKGLIVLDDRTKRVEYKENFKQGEGFMCVMPNGRIFVSQFSSNTVVELFLDGRNPKIRFSKEDGISSPTAMCYDQRAQKLIIVCYKQQSEMSKSRFCYLLRFSLDFY